ncbi:dbp-2 [Sucra jujuba nucleopolyhedrovirus]|uniref:Dbp-2 n=1 Tax=Sucra jujuba nucleopolyhedrovirus TaxID=1563660 RepID=A0A097P8U4_9ABAC|nr:dbp-2 [Sucra jujuba nucleopolyhedrovirus]AIU41252.1 dbp-2 [Sucra jujuba nucleopolyhedrovirus]
MFKKLKTEHVAVDTRNNCSNDDDDEDLIVFDETQLQKNHKDQLITWQDKFINKLQCENNVLKVVASSAFLNKVHECLAPIMRCVKYEDNMQLVYKRTTRATNYNTYHVEKQFLDGNNTFKTQNVYIFESVTVERCRGSFGEYLTIRWPGIHKINCLYAQALRKHFNNPVCLKTNINLTIPNGEKNPLAKSVFVRKFFDVDRNKNSVMYMTGCVPNAAPVEVTPFTVSMFDNVFKLRNRDTSNLSVQKGDPIEASASVDSIISLQMVMGAVIEGVKEYKSGVKLQNNTNNKAVEINSFVLAVKPMIFIKLQ